MDPVAAITEAQARGEIATLYADIRATLGVPVVNLVWRHLATIEGALPWAWGAVRPAYRSGAVAAATARLKAGWRGRLPVLTPVPSEVLASLGMGAQARQAMAAVLSAYDRSNPMNFIALSALLAPGEAGSGDAAAGAPIDGPSDVPSDVPFDASAGASDPLEAPLPRLLALDEMAPATAALVLRLNDLGTVGSDIILASMYRHLAGSPGLLALIWAQLSGMTASGALQGATATVLALADEEARRVARVLGNGSTAGQHEPPSQPPQPSHPQGRAALADFLARIELPRMIAVTAILKAALVDPAPGQGATGAP
jgi:hypothetical protein